MKFQKDRSGYRSLLRKGIKEFGVSLLTYNITSNHVHMLVYAEEEERVSRLVQQVAGDFARRFNRRKHRSGAFWEGRYHATMVDGGGYLHECMRYVELNMVRCKVVSHPRQWDWSGYQELMGVKKRNRLLDLDRLLQLLGNGTLEDFRGAFECGLAGAISKEELGRLPQWTESLAVGGQDFVEKLEGRIRNRQQLEKEQVGGAWILREPDGAVYGTKK